MLIVLSVVAPGLSPAIDRPAGTSAQQQPPGIQFQARADLILIDASIVDSAGVPIGDIRPDEFVVAVDNQQRPIASVQFVRTDPPADARRPSSASHYSSNEGLVTGRQVLVVVDENSIPPGAGRAALASLERFMSDLSPADRVGFVRLPGFENSVEFTTDRARLREAVKRVVGKAQSGMRGRVSIGEAVAREQGDDFTWDRAIDRICQGESGPSLDACIQDAGNEAVQMVFDVDRRARESLHGLEQLVGNLRQVPGAKTVVLLSQGLVAGNNRPQIQRVASLAAAARVSVYVLQMDLPSMDAGTAFPSSTRGEDERIVSEGLDDLAGAARGVRFRIIGTGQGVFQRVARELSGHYLIGIEPTEADRDGRTHRVHVEVTREGVTVRARSQFTIDGAAAASAIPAAPADRLLELLRAPTAQPGLPLRVAAFALPGDTAGRVKVVVGAEVGTPSAAPVDVHVGLILVDRDGKVAANQLGSVTLQPAGAGPAPLRYAAQVDVPPGEYTLRLAVIDAEGTAGSVHHPVAASLKKAGAVAVSDLVVTTAARPVSGLRPEVHLNLEGPAMQAILELTSADARQLGGATVTFEVAERTDGPAIVTQAGRLSNASDAKRSAAAVLEVGVLPAGSYIARAVVQVPGERPLTATRPFDIARRRSAAAAPAALPRGESRGRIRPPIPAFKPEDVLAPDVVNPFIDHVLEEYSPSPAAREALEAIRAGHPGDAAKGTREIGDVGLAFAQGLGLLAANRPKEADAYFRAALRQSSDFIGAAFYLGATLAAAGRDRDAVGAWQTALIGEVGAAGIYPVLIDGLLRLGDAGEALEFLQEAEPTFADRSQYTRRLVQAYALAARYDEARPLAHEYLAAHPDDLDMLFMAMHLVYEGHAGGALPDEAAELARFAEYAARYEARQGPQALVVQGWRKALGIR